MRDDHFGAAAPAGAPATRLDVDPEVSILIVAFRSKRFILDCIRSIYAHTKQTRFEILLIDNSNDGSAELVAEHAPMVRIVSTDTNLGFACGNNRLAAVARGGLLLLLNPDTCLRSDAVDRLAAFARSKPEAGAWGGLTVTPEGALDAGNRLVIPSLGRLLCWAMGKGDALSDGGLAAGADTPAPVEVLSGSFMMVRRDVWTALGGFDESFFLYSEEIDFFLRLRREGFEAWATPDALVIHDVGSGDRRSPERLRYLTTGRAHFVRTHWPPAKAAVALCLLWIGTAARWAGAAVLSAFPRAPGRWRSARRGYAGLVWRPWRWWGGYRR
jgi:GT2 family glycosyltransferase